MDKKTKLTNCLLKEFLCAYQSSELYNEVNSVVNELMGFLAHLMNEKEDIELFFKFLPRIIFETPHESKNTPLGHEHFYDISALKTSAREAGTMREFIKPFMLNKKQDHGGELKYFNEYRPVQDNAPMHSNEHADYRAVFSYKNIDQLKKLCNKTGVDYGSLIKESCLTVEINNIPVFVSYSFDKSSQKGNLELHISDPDDPYIITGKLRGMAKEADNILKNALWNKSKIITRSG